MKKSAASLALSLLFAWIAFAQAQVDRPDMVIDAATRSQVIETTLKHLNDFYVFPDEST